MMLLLPRTNNNNTSNNKHRTTKDEDEDVEDHHHHHHLPNAASVLLLLPQASTPPRSSRFHVEPPPPPLSKRSQQPWIRCNCLLVLLMMASMSINLFFLATTRSKENDGGSNASKPNNFHYYVTTTSSSSSLSSSSLMTLTDPYHQRMAWRHHQQHHQQHQHFNRNKKGKHHPNSYNHKHHSKSSSLDRSTDHSPLTTKKNSFDKTISGTTSSAAAAATTTTNATSSKEDILQIIWERRKQFTTEIQEMHQSQDIIQQQAAALMQRRRQKDKNLYQELIKDTITNDYSDDEEYMSACLLIKDDNHILSEWIAYHYHTMKLRYIIVALDPSSQLLPHEILQNWQEHTDLTFTIWSDNMYMPKEFLRLGYLVPPHLITKTNANESKWHEGHESPAQVRADKLRIANHRFRQKTFLARCIQTLRNWTDEKNRKNNNNNNKNSNNNDDNNMKKNAPTWMMHIDTDEYVVINPLLRTEQAWQDDTDEDNVSIPYRPTNVSVPNALFILLQQLVANGRAKIINYPCISLPRLQFGSIEDTTTLPSSASTEDEEDQEQEALFPNTAASKRQRYYRHHRRWNVSNFETLRWMYHTSYTDGDRNGQPKVIVDVTNIPSKDRMVASPKVFSIHRPSLALCRNKDQMDFNSTRRYPLTINHYLGTWERYSTRNDSRRTYRAFKANANLKDGRDDWIMDWLDGFVNVHGVELTATLLGDRYVLKHKNN